MIKILRNLASFGAKPILPERLVAAERSILGEEARLFPSFKGRVSVRINGPRFPVYESTSCEAIMRYFDSMTDHRVFAPKKDGFKCTVLGSGLGRSVAAISCVEGSDNRPLFRNVTGFELDSRMADASRRIFKENGINSVKILNEDFMKADISEFDFVFLFKPFIETPYRFVRKLKETKPGTVIVSRDFPYSPIGGTMMVTILDNNDFDLGQFLMVTNRPKKIGDANFFTYVRR